MLLRAVLAGKGIRRFLRVWSAQRRPGDRLSIVGVGEGDYGRQVEAEAAATHGVSLLGWQDRAGMRAVLQESDALVLPSGIEDDDLRENFGNVVAEALASDRPVLVAAGLAWDHAEAEGFGVVFGHEMDNAIAEGIGRLQAMSPQALSEMGKAGRRYVERYLDVRVTSDLIWRQAVAVMAGR